MSISLGNVGGSSDADQSSVTLSATIDSGTDNILVVFCHGSNAAWSSVVFNTSESLTAVTGAAYGATGDFIQIWYLVNPTVTTANIVATPANQDFCSIDYGVFHGVDQSIPFGSSINQTGGRDVAVTSISDNLTTVYANSWVIGGATLDGTPTVTLGADQTAIATQAGSTIKRVTSYETKATPGSVTMSYSWTGSRDCSQAIVELVETQPKKSPLTLLGVG